MPDRTTIAVRKQLQGLCCANFDIGVRDRAGRMMRRIWNQAETINSIGWLRHQNALGSDIYVRPGGDQNQGIILVDDINRSTVKRLAELGLDPSVVVETSPANFQVWIRLSDSTLEPAVATMAARICCEELQADPNSADWRHFGRLAGFTNRKPEHVSERGHYPWVLCHMSRRVTAARGALIIESAAKQVHSSNTKLAKKRTALRAPEALFERTSMDKLASLYLNHFERLSERYGAEFDPSRADFMISRHFAQWGIQKPQLVELMMMASPSVASRKSGHLEDYCQRTVEAAFEAIESEA